MIVYISFVHPVRVELSKFFEVFTNKVLINEVDVIISFNLRPVLRW